jgi:hypothetical protein
VDNDSGIDLEIPRSSGGGPGVIYVKYSHADQLIVKDGVPTVGQYWNMEKDKFDPTQTLVLKVGETEFTQKAKAGLSEKEFEQIQTDHKKRGEFAMKRRGYLSQTANVTPQIVYSLFYKDNILHVEKSILQQLKAQNFHKEIQHGTESFKCSLKDIQSVCEHIYNKML